MSACNVGVLGVSVGSMKVETLLILRDEKTAGVSKTYRMI